MLLVVEQKSLFMSKLIEIITADGALIIPVIPRTHLGSSLISTLETALKLNPQKPSVTSNPITEFWLQVLTLRRKWEAGPKVLKIIKTKDDVSEMSECYKERILLG